MNAPLKPIKPKRISDQVLEQLRELIFRSEFKPGQQIPPERELAEALKVSRTSVRDAIGKLVAMGLLEQHQGQGTFVRMPEPTDKHPLAVAMETQNASLEDLLEVRMGLECNAASLAAVRAEESDLEFLEKSVDDMRKEVQAGRLGTEADVAFHMAVTYATKNPLQVYLMRSFYDYLFVGIKENLAYLYEDPANIEKIIEQHTTVFKAIQEHDPDRAFDTMRRHIDFVLTFFRKRRTQGLR
jgi:GntR family transcriptional repressor for pyruvate dehydrogenase complex